MTDTLDISQLESDGNYLEIDRAPIGYSGPSLIGPFSTSSDAHRFAERLKKRVPGLWTWFVYGMVSALAVNRAMAGADALHPIPAGLCGEASCVFLTGHEGEHSWGGAS